MKSFVAAVTLIASAAYANDYADPATWLCHGSCRAALDATIVEADGTTKLDAYQPAAAPTIDCFYVYPTVSKDQGPNADMVPGPEEHHVVEQQLARFGAVCRPFSPVYRQITTAALHAAMAGGEHGDRALAYGDVKAAWDAYLAHDNGGRGVVLIGHSQGAGMLIELVKREIEGKPIQRRIVSIILAGGRLQVPVGKDVGGDFASIPLCRKVGQVGCAMQFDSFRATSPPPADARFGVSTGAGLEAACTNPAALAGGKGALHAYFPGRHAWTSTPIATPFVELPGMLTAECVREHGKSYLAVTIAPNPTGKRATDIGGDFIGDGGVIDARWGLHRVDINLTIGNLIDDVRAQATTYTHRAP